MQQSSCFAWVVGKDDSEQTRPDATTPRQHDYLVAKADVCMQRCINAGYSRQCRQPGRSGCRLQSRRRLVGGCSVIIRTISLNQQCSGSKSRHAPKLTKKRKSNDMNMGASSMQRIERVDPETKTHPCVRLRFSRCP